MDEIMLRVENVSKRYKLGQIGGTTLRDELQRKMAKIRGQEDPTRRIGSQNYKQGETFMALDGVSFDVKKGERVGIIGHNGAGKSTLLKLISRVTAPTEGRIQMNGRVTSMLEVGTGFHGELTGRENIYMNGAILGMTKKEIDAKMEDIIEFSEVRQFIDTPVKRYSSGMYVKLAFSVAAHLDSEIMIMDEVLAVGDMAFQKKCLSKMNAISRNEGKTLLYVSHNMSTIRHLCDRCILLNHGNIKFDGDVETAISLYMHSEINGFLNCYNLVDAPRHGIFNGDIMIQSVRITQDIPLIMRDKLSFILTWKAENCTSDMIIIRVLVGNENGLVGIAMSEEVCNMPDINKVRLTLDTSMLATGRYFINIELFDKINGKQTFHDSLRAMQFEIIDNERETVGFSWYKPWGMIYFPKLEAVHE